MAKCVTSGSKRATSGSKRASAVRCSHRRTLCSHMCVWALPVAKTRQRRPLFTPPLPLSTNMCVWALTCWYRFEKVDAWRLTGVISRKHEFEFVALSFVDAVVERVLDDPRANVGRDFEG